MNTVIKNITQLLKERFDRDISSYNDTFIRNMLSIRMKELLCDDPALYLKILATSADEPELLCDILNNSFSEFFRDPLTFSLIEHLVIPGLFRQAERLGRKEIRIWSAGCAAGQEPYSLAILLKEYKSIRQSGINFRIFATDRSEKEIIEARSGSYSEKALQNSRLSILNSYFKKSGEYYSVNDFIKESVDFSVFDLLKSSLAFPAPSVYGDFDLIMCCNLLFYYNDTARKKILRKIHSAMTDSGILVTGDTESENIKSFGGFRKVHDQSPVFIKENN